MMFPTSFKLALMCCSCLHRLLPWVASCSFVMHHACCASCLVYVWCVYHVVCFFSIVPVSLRSWGFVRLRLVCLRPFVFFMDSFFFLAGFQARWLLPWISLLSLLCQLLRSIAMLRYLVPVYQAIPYCHEPLTFDTFPMQTVVLLCYRFCSAPLIALLVAGEVEDCYMVDRIMLGYHNISYLINASIYLVKGGRLGLMPSVLFHLPALVSVISVLCSQILRSLHGWVIYGTPLTVRFE